MVRFADLFGALLGALIVVLSASAAAAPEIPLLDGYVTAEQWEALPENPALNSCDSTVCGLLRSLVRSFGELDARDLPNSMARAEPSRVTSEPVSVVRRVSTAPREGDTACRMLSVLARSFFDWSVGLHTVEIASLLEPLRSGCVPEVVSAFPSTQETQSLLANAAEFCQVRNEAACKLIVPRSGYDVEHR